ncbi:hypothetical protein PV10_00084 [Exophiala mesophila]|uniref:Uncharacterized protein n=1 Tax=Exophiala mesophila TaxID=212818 RepID=A0A0D1ZNH0_EXOME|nr:uncharacterized protein PV10_00084 [Exophiala mesophila]KIV96187.1 hypothetical protein PV10_00084 [Exophiala mesophila]
MGNPDAFPPCPSPLLDLPSEIRNQIWSLTFAEQALVPSKSHQNLQQDGCVGCLKHDQVNPLPWAEVFEPLLTCRQIYAEAFQIFISSFTLHLNECFFTTDSLCPPFPAVNRQLRSLVLWVHVDEENRSAWAERLKSITAAFPNLQSLTLLAHMRPPDEYDKLIDAIALAVPIARFTHLRPDMELSLVFEYTYHGVMFDSPYLGEITTGDAIDEHELIVRDLVEDDAFVEAALGLDDEENHQAMVAALLRIARAHEQSWFQKLQRKMAARVMQLAELATSLEQTGLEE